MMEVTSLGSPTFFILASILVFLILSRKKIPRQKRNFFLFLLILSVIGGMILNFLLKNIIQKARPINPLINVTGYSFPSFHAMQSIIFYSLLIIIFKDDFKNITLKYIFIALNLLLIMLIGFSRIYLQVHWVSDVIGGYMIGLGWLFMVYFIAKKVYPYQQD